ncbi:acetate kinase [Fusibacillus kribbianus]|uniref:Acetate kinase n=1 Tax=Fusibacillus kribbianus TaxID=3044208 RepID=A0AAP4BAY4_9FIRM|nr:acetate kinase [Ruminococcus sp. YH-rum2234]MDI9242295.1 acetate kinase [Ruminococcus sp. YH-rum2234]
MKVLIINCGSSSLKYQIIDSETEQVQAKGLCERIGIDGRLIYQPAGGEKEVTEAPMPTHTEAIQMVLDALVNEKTGVLKSLDEVDAIGHRVLHGGAKITQSCIINDEVLQVVEECCDLGPLHNPANLKGIYACQKLMPGKPNVAVFDTAFHQTMPTKAFMYGIPYEYYEKYHIRKYGFHGTSHSFVSKETIKFLGLDPDNSKVIVCHLGNGASISAVKDSKCVDTSMGLTPLEGLVMGTRSGDIDPAVVEYICNKEGKTVSEMLNILNKKSGVYGLTKGLSSDFRDLEEAMADGNQLAADAIDIFCYRVAKIVGSYVAAMNGVDAIAFTAGIGENAPLIREKVCEYLGFLGVKIDAAKNNCRGKEVVISADDSAKLVAVVPTNEELAIMRETVALVK